MDGVLKDAQIDFVLPRCGSQKPCVCATLLEQKARVFLFSLFDIYQFPMEQRTRPVRPSWILIRQVCSSPGKGTLTRFRRRRLEGTSVTGDGGVTVMPTGSVVNDATGTLSALPM